MPPPIFARHTLLTLTLLTTGWTCAQEAPVQVAPSPQAKALQGFLKSSSLKTASVGFCLIPLSPAPPLKENPDTGKKRPPSYPKALPTLQHNADLALIPASTLKAVTTATALQTLGDQFTFQTKLFLQNGNLIIQGGGDPTLASSSLNVEFPAWLAALKKASPAGLTELSGDLIADPTHFESQNTPNEWPWGDIGNYYGSGTHGLNFHQNSYALNFAPGKIGSPAKLTSTNPTPPGVTFNNLMRTGSSFSGDQGYAYAGGQSKVVTLRGTVPGGRKSYTIHGSLPDPALSCLTAFRDYLKKNNFPVRGKLRVSDKKVPVRADQEIHSQSSPPLHRLIITTNHKSINLNAEAIFKSLTPSGTAKEAAKKVKAHWQAQGIDMTGFEIQDGSGLSPRNTITARQLATIMLRAHQHESGAIFKKSLPTAGKSGTLTSFGNGTAAAGRVTAKSGNLTRVRCYAGYLSSKSGQKYAFAILTNNAHANPKAAIVNLLAQLATH